MAGKRFLGLDGLRGVCALTVLLFHASDLFHSGPLSPHGYLAVDMFFLLSGFVIAFVHESHLKAGRSLSWFLRARARRLLPVFYLGATFNIAVFIAMASAGYYPPGFSAAAIWVIVPLTTLMMLPAFGIPDNGFSPAMMNVTWSLSIEWLVNIAYAAIGFRCRTRTLAMVAVGGWAVMAVTGYFTGMGWCVGMSRGDFLSLGLLRGAPSFLAGVVLYRLRARGWFDRLPVIAPELLLTLWLCIAVVPTFTATPTFDWIAVTLLFPLLMMLILRSEDRTPAFCKTLGEMSYPLYVVHPGIILLARNTPLFGLDRGPDPLRSVVVTGLCVGAAWAISVFSRLRPRFLSQSKAAV
ncbi:MAG TPA: acyltransferase [Rhizomicrobium sp.]|nr:acyltransferase [Rhizomicrobium sp.]